MDSRLLMYAILESDSAAIHSEVSGQISSSRSPPGRHSGIRNLGTVPGAGWGEEGSPHPQLQVLREFQADMGRGRGVLDDRPGTFGTQVLSKEVT